MASPNVIATGGGRNLRCQPGLLRIEWKKDTMISRTRLTRSSGPVTRLSACFAGMAALAAATLGFASAAGAAGTAPLPQLARPSAGVHPLAAGSSAYLARLPGDPHWWPGQRQRHLHGAQNLVHDNGHEQGCGRVERRLHGLAQHVRLGCRPVVFRAAQSTNGSSVRWRAPSTSPVRRRATSSSPRCSSRAARPLPSSTT